MLHLLLANKNDNYVIFTRRGFDTKKYPAITNHLNRFRKKLEPKPNDWNEDKNGKWEGRKPGDYTWYDFQDNIAYHPVFEKEKLVWLSISDKPAFALDTKRMYVTAPAYIMTSNEGLNKYLLALLNSKTLEWYLDKVSSSTGQGTNQWSKIFVEQLPICRISFEEQKPFIELVNRILPLTQSEDYPSNPPKQSQVKALEQEIDQMVYQLYNLTDEEIRIVKEGVC
ncbi:MAG: TaqI-like C-terminal specificity domain-containing protein, partial [Candidatus Desantisbacteria bacterium]